MPHPVTENPPADSGNCHDEEAGGPERHRRDRHQSASLQKHEPDEEGEGTKRGDRQEMPPSSAGTLLTTHCGVPILRGPRNAQRRG